MGAIAALLLLSRFFVENLAAQGYLDISYLALILWALALELERPGGARPCSCCWRRPGCCAPTPGC